MANGSDPLAKGVRLGIDIGGSSLKAALVDTETGRLVSERIEHPTPDSFSVDAVSAAIAKLVEEYAWTGPFGVGFPAAVRDGVVRSPPTAHEVPGWEGQRFAEHLSDRQGAFVSLINDADAAGLAESAFGAARDRGGVVLVFTLGTGVGSALLLEGRLVPNCELGKLYLPGQARVSEQFVASRVRVEENLSWEEWGQRVAAYLEHIDRLFTPNLVVLGGGVSRFADRFQGAIDLRCPVEVAALGNDAGLVGAASSVAPNAVGGTARGTA